jgi:hypothetical protein
MPLICHKYHTWINPHLQFWTDVENPISCGCFYISSVIDSCLEPGKIDALKFAWFRYEICTFCSGFGWSIRGQTPPYILKDRWKFKYSLCIIVTDADSCNCVTLSSAWFSDIIETYQSRMNGLNNKKLLLEQFNVLPRTIDGSHRYNGLPLES